MTQPAQPQTAPAPDAIVVPVATPQPQPPVTTTLTEEEVNRRIEAARQQEKDKLYERLEAEAAARKKLEEQMQAFNTDLTARQQAEEEARKAAEAAAEEKRLAELSFGEKLTETEQRFSSQVQTLQQQLAERDAILEKERQFNELVQYVNQQMQTEVGQSIIPELRDMVVGNTREEIDASISALAQRSATILQQVASVAQDARQGARGVGVTAPPVGPLDNNSGYETVTADDVRNMDMATYAQNRGRLLGAASQQQRDRGMFG